VKVFKEERKEKKGESSAKTRGIEESKRA